MQHYDHEQLDFLTAVMPSEVWTLPAELAAVDRLLPDPTIVAPLLVQLDPVRGRPSIPAAQILRLLYLKDRYQLADRVLMQEVADSFHCRRLTGPSRPASSRRKSSAVAAFAWIPP